MLTQNETRALSRAIYQRWYPQLFVDDIRWVRTVRACSFPSSPTLSIPT